MPIVLKSGSLNLLEPTGPVQDCNRIALPLSFKHKTILSVPVYMLVLLLYIGKCTLGVELENWEFKARAPVKAATPHTDPAVYITFPTAYSETVTSPNKQATDINTVGSGRCYNTDRTLLPLTAGFYCQC